MPFFIIFVMIPLLEIMVFISVSDKIGLGTALLMALCTAILGGIIVKYQGIRTMFTAQQSMKKGKIPSQEIFDGLCLVAAGATLITPGFITDALGFALLIPAIRNVLRKKLAASAQFKSVHIKAGYTESHTDHRPTDPDVIDVDYETIEEKDEP